MTALFQSCENGGACTQPCHDAYPKYRLAWRGKFEKSLRLFSNRKFCALAVYKTAIPAEPEPTQTFRVILKGMVINMKVPQKQNRRPSPPEGKETVCFLYVRQESAFVCREAFSHREPQMIPAPPILHALPNARSPFQDGTDTLPRSALPMP